AQTSQFENHLRAITGLPLGPTPMRPGITHAGMLNLVGDHPPVSKLLTVPGARVHLYGKAPKPGRKVGHLNFGAASETALRASMEAAGTMLPR
ncbi:MAG: hypothetical protein KDA16_10885, partial [Phycisphaerales bacterium]|nr:hypothetical protein [Phycisphaerales bacterium]